MGDISGARSRLISLREQAGAGAGYLSVVNSRLETSLDAESADRHSALENAALHGVRENGKETVTMITINNKPV